MEDRHRHGDRKHRVTSSCEQRETDSSDERAIRVETRTRESVCVRRHSRRPEKTLQQRSQTCGDNKSDGESQSQRWRWRAKCESEQPPLREKKSRHGRNREEESESMRQESMGEEEKVNEWTERRSQRNIEDETRTRECV